VQIIYHWKANKNLQLFYSNLFQIIKRLKIKFQKSEIFINTYFELIFQTADRNGTNDIPLESYWKCATFVSLQVFSNSVWFSSNFENTIFQIY
jgi:hypothetical protein